MGSVWVRISLFLSSYFPLAVIFFVLYIGELLWVAVAILAVGVAGLVGMALYLWQVNRFEPSREKAIEVRKRDLDVMGYLMGYIVPFLAIPFGGWARGIALSIFFLVLGFLYVNSNMVYLNPVLTFIGFRLYEVTLKDGGVHFLITRRRVVRGQTLSVIKAGEDILLEKRNGSRETSRRQSRAYLRESSQP